MNMPPKNKTSVTRNTHMTSEALSRCWSNVSNCPYNSPVRCTRRSSLDLYATRVHASLISLLLVVLVVPVGRRQRRVTLYVEAQIVTIVEVVRLPIDFGRDIEIFGERRRRGLPLKPRCRPWVRSCDLSVAHRPRQINHRQQVAERENRGTRRGHHVKHLKLGWIAVIAARHAEIAENKLREERQVEPNEKSDCGRLRQTFGIQSAGNLRPPEVQSTDVAHHRAADHDVVEVRDDEIGVVKVDVQAEAG